MRKMFFIEMNRVAVAQLLLLLLCIVSCNNIENDLFPQNEDSAVQTDEHGRTVYTCAMEFDGGLQGFDGVTKSGVVTRAAENWNDGDVVYLVFNSGDKNVEGKGVYSSDNGKWTLYYYGQLAPTDSSYCVAHFFDGNVTLNRAETEFTISPTTAVYGSTGASYSKSGRVVKVKATLAPLTGRISFRGDTGYNFSLNGFDYYNSYSLTNGTLTSNSLDINMTIDDSGETDFYYGFFPDDSQHKLTVTTDNAQFEQNCEDDVLALAHSGSMPVPTLAMYNDWMCKRELETITFTIGDIHFDMIRVKAGIFGMGTDNYNTYGNYQVSLTQDYYIGKTEVTQGLWQAVMGYDYAPVSSDGNKWEERYGLGNDYPAYYISWNNCQTFLSNLNGLTGRSFRMPTEAEWEFAARGGNKSNGFTFSGSSELNDVGWYGDNCHEFWGYGLYDQRVHIVATKLPNELGIYDMSGNLYEWCSDYYDSYESDMTGYNNYVIHYNPQGPYMGSNRVCRGGCFTTDYTSCSVATRSYRDPWDASSNIGLRLCLSAN